MDTNKIPDDLKKETLSISCVIQLIIEEEYAEEIDGMLNSVSVLNQVIPEDMVEEQKKDHILKVVLSVCYSWRTIKIISHCKGQVKCCMEIFVAV